MWLWLCLARPESAGISVAFLSSWEVVFELWVSCVIHSGVAFRYLIENVRILVLCFDVEEANPIFASGFNVRFSVVWYLRMPTYMWEPNSDS